MGLFSSPKHKKENGVAPGVSNGNGAFVASQPVTEAQIKRATRTRKIWCIATAVLLFISVIFLILVEIGNTFDKPVLRNIWFINLNLTDVRIRGSSALNKKLIIYRLSPPPYQIAVS